MNYSVFWLQRAEAELARLWNAGPDRAAVAAAANKIDVLLKTDPQNSGESRDAGRRILIEHLLAVLYRVSVGDMKVEVIISWRSRKAP